MCCSLSVSNDCDYLTQRFSLGYIVRRLQRQEKLYAKTFRTTSPCICQLKMPSLKFVRQAFMINAQLVQERRL